MPSPLSTSEILLSEPARDNNIDALLGGTYWKKSEITYSFPYSNSTSFWSSSSKGYSFFSDSSEPWNAWFNSLTSSDKINFKYALSQWENVADIEFIEVSETTKSVGDIRAAYTFDDDESVLAWTYLPSTSPLSGDIWINTQSQLNGENWNPGTLSFETILHEIGHALGLRHPFDDLSDSRGTSLPSKLDNTAYTIMSYTYANLEDVVGTGFSFHPTTPMVLDIAAIQYLYGKNDDFHKGDNSYLYDDKHTYHETIWDAGGTDTINYTGSIPSFFDLHPMSGSMIGQSVYVQDNGINLGSSIPNIWIADSVLIENVTAGKGDDIIIGNDLSNKLNGGSGVDTVIVESTYDQFTLSKNLNGYTLTEKDNANNSDKLISIERLEFDDFKLALDLDDHAGNAVKMLGAVFGATAAIDPMQVGIALTKLDQGDSYEQLGNTLIQATGLTDHDQIASLLWKNLFGYTPKHSEIAPYVDLLDHGEISIGALAILAADSSYNLQNVNFFELPQTGVQFI